MHDMTCRCSCGTQVTAHWVEPPSDVTNNNRLSFSLEFGMHQTPGAEWCNKRRPELFSRGLPDPTVTCAGCGRQVNPDARNPQLAGYHEDPQMLIISESEEKGCLGIGHLAEEYVPKPENPIIKPLPALQPQEPTLLGKGIDAAQGLIEALVPQSAK